MGEGSVEPVRSKVQAIKQVPTPTNKREVQRFLGLVGYYRSFIPNFSEIATPLTDCIRKVKKGVWTWNPKCQATYECLKEKLCEAPVLKAQLFKAFLGEDRRFREGPGNIASSRFWGRGGTHYVSESETDPSSDWILNY